MPSRAYSSLNTTGRREARSQGLGRKPYYSGLLSVGAWRWTYCNEVLRTWQSICSSGSGRGLRPCSSSITQLSAIFARLCRFKAQDRVFCLLRVLCKGFGIDSDRQTEARIGKQASRQRKGSNAFRLLEVNVKLRSQSWSMSSTPCCSSGLQWLPV